MNRIAIAPFILLTGCAAMLPAPMEAPPAAPVAPKAQAPAAPAKAAAPTAKAPVVSKPVAAPPAAVAKPAAAPPTLDLKTLEQQLKETKAIGVMTKLSIKNQVDDLLEQFRAYYQGKVKTSLENLRRSYDLLVMKVLALLQDGDQALAKAVAGSREAIWGILADRDKFAKI